MMSPPCRPSMAERTMSTPLSIEKSATSLHSNCTAPRARIGLNVLTPPPSPRHARSSSALSNISDNSLSDDLVDPTRHGEQKLDNLKSGAHSHHNTVNGILTCPYQVEILQDHRERSQVFGYGAWSIVYKGTCHSKPTSGLATPPPTPMIRPPVLVAVKQAARKDAGPILESEARILTHLMAELDCESSVVPFYGVIPSSQSLVLAAMPCSLDEHIKRSATAARTTFSTWNMSEPVVGNTAIWLDLAYKLVSGLAWLHSKAMVIHGDIKPGNILLDRLIDNDETDTTDLRPTFPYQPLFADFSSSQRIDDEITLNTLSAITREYTAPELLSSKVLSDPKSTATTASDVFSLAVTLLVAATGNTMVYSGSVFQRQAMATQGWMVIQTVRNSPMDEAARVPRQGVVEKALDRAVLRHSASRVDADSWKSLLGDLMQPQSSKA